MKDKRICIRVDANEKIATGHFMRCHSIALALRKCGTEPVFITADACMEGYITGDGFAHIVLNTPWDKPELELDYLLPYVKDTFDIMLLDSYLVTEHYMQRLKQAITLVYIDDLYLFEYACNMLVNYTNYHTLFHYKRLPDRQLLLGTQYAPLQMQFAELKRPPVKDTIQNVLFLTGGTDEFHFTIKFIQRIVLDKELSAVQFFLICGRFHKDVDILKELEMKQRNLHIVIQTSKMSDCMLKADFAVSAAGTALYELCACRTPAVSYILADNQTKNARSFHQEGIIPCAGDIRTDMEGCLRKIKVYLFRLRGCRKERKSWSDQMMKKVDGLGSQRIAESICKL